MGFAEMEDVGDTALLWGEPATLRHSPSELYLCPCYPWDPQGTFSDCSDHWLV